MNNLEEQSPNDSDHTLELPHDSIQPAILNYRTPDNTPALGGYTLTRREKILAIIALCMVCLLAYSLTFRSHISPNTLARVGLVQIKAGLEMFVDENKRYPTTAEGLTALVTNPGNLEHWERTLDKLPIDSWGHPYIYRGPSQNGLAFDLLSAGPDGKEGTADDVTLNPK